MPIIQSIFFKAALWLMTELCLTALGLDDLADYGEFLFQVRSPLPSQQASLAAYECCDGTCVLRHSQHQWSLSPA